MSEYDDLLRPIKLRLKFAMLDVLNVNWKVNIWSTITFLLIALLNCGPIGFLCHHVGEIEKIQDIAEAGGVMGSAISLITKAIVSVLKRKEIISFSDNIKQLYSESLNDHPDIINVFAKNFSLITKLFCGVVYILPVLYVITSTFGNGELQLPLLMEFPFISTEGWPFFHVVLVAQIAAMWPGVNLVAAFELLPLFFIQYVCCRIEILCRMIDHWNFNIKCSRNDIDARRNNLLLAEIVQYHSSIKRNMDSIQSIFSPMLSATLLTNSIVVCMCLTIIFVNPVLKMVSHIVMALCQTFMYCYVGKILLDQNDKLVERVMLVDYYYLNVSDRKSYMNVVQNVCNPITLQAYFVTVDMTLFCKVLKFAYSVFSVMKTKV